jgi:hypothetical protein
VYRSATKALRLIGTNLSLEPGHDESGSLTTQQIWMEVCFQGHGTLLGQEINDTGTYRQTVRPGGVLYGEGHVLMMSAGDIVDWVGGGGGPTHRTRIQGQLRSVGFGPDNL